ncbi:unnamed protein product [Ceutorhynchus assimilis]|uniref:Peptidase M16C associated domain-containing protein n=1 Tax=Ceutorhynchus assimilis TaxID=467358 RepID=A0A9N9MMQ0_9CUCU|nr:unnamed protein product [Ceutorhynchus assimilis]
MLKHESKNFGLNLLFGVTILWNHSNEVLTALEVNAVIKKLRSELKNNPNYLQETIKTYFKENNHKLVLTMSPDKEYEAELEKAEIDLINKKTKNLDDKDKKVVFEKCLELQKLQKATQNSNLLRTLQMDDRNSDTEKINKVTVCINNVPLK